MRTQATARPAPLLPQPPAPPAPVAPAAPLRLRTANLSGPVRYVDFGGPRRGPTVVLVHGLGTCHLSWLPTAPLLAQHARVLALDLVGFGHTPRAGRTAGLATQRALLSRFLTEVVREPVVLLGHSMGGLLALAQAAEGRAPLLGLGLVAPAQPLSPRTPLDGALVRRFLLHALPGLGELALWRDGQQKGARGLVMDLLSLGAQDVARIPPEVVDATVALVAGQVARAPWEHGRGYLQATRSLLPALLRRERFARWAAAVRVPTLLAHGVQDRVVPFRASLALARQRPDWRFEAFGGVGHVPQMEDAGRFVPRVLHWLGALGLTGRRAAPTTARG